MITSVSSWLNGSIRTDTPTNVLPSLHVLQLYLLLHRNFPLREAQHSRLIQKGSLVLSILIILSTMFLKQHSVVDVVAACVMAYFMYSLIYAQEGAKVVLADLALEKAQEVQMPL